MTETGFFDWGSEQPDEARAKFESFHADNPHVYTLFCRFTLQAIAAGRGRYSARMIIERIRWHTTIETSSHDYKINGNHVPFYARLFERDHPAHRGLFERRRAVADALD